MSISVILAVILAHSVAFLTLGLFLFFFFLLLLFLFLIVVRLVVLVRRLGLLAIRLVNDVFDVFEIAEAELFVHGIPLLHVDCRGVFGGVFHGFTGARDALALFARVALEPVKFLARLRGQLLVSQ